MDLCDQAADVEMLQRDQALVRHTRGMRRGPSAFHCQHCGEDIPAARRHAVPGVQSCVDCQEKKEREAKR